MLYLIERLAKALLPASLHRALMPVAHWVRHRWRRLFKLPLCGVSVVIHNTSGEILLLRHSYGPDLWALPGGGLNRGEHPEECARREVREEIGLTLGSLQSFASLDEELSGSRHTAHLFTAVCEAQPRPDGREVVEARFFAVDALPERMGRVTKRRIEAWQRR